LRGDGWPGKVIGGEDAGGGQKKHGQGRRQSAVELHVLINSDYAF
jgi:hypothetical protein